MRVNLTGFGRFQGVSENPSAKLVEMLPPLLEPLNCVYLNKAVVCEVSVEGVQTILPGLYDDDDSMELLNIHLGVYAGATGFSLEKLAHNEANFRCVDEKGLQLCGVGILPDVERSATLNTSLDLEDIKNRLTEKGWGREVEISEDPGRFLCNYIYTASLHRCLERPRKHALFVHIPLASEIPLPRQAAFIVDLIQEIVLSLQAGKVNACRVSSGSSALGRGGGGAGAKSGDIEAERLKAVSDLASLGFTGSLVSRVLESMAVPLPSLDYLVARILEFQEEEEKRGALPLPAFDLTSLLPPPPPKRYKMVVVARSDLELSPGKLAAQACHAALAAHRFAISATTSASGNNSHSSQTVLSQWRAGGEKIVILRGPTGGGEMGGLGGVIAAAARLGLPHFAVRDAGRTEVEPGTVTVLAVGPAEEGEVDAVTGSLKLYA